MEAKKEIHYLQKGKQVYKKVLKSDNNSAALKLQKKFKKQNANFVEENFH